LPPFDLIANVILSDCADTAPVATRRPAISRLGNVLNILRLR
jgi:hypothetical protein